MDSNIVVSIAIPCYEMHGQGGLFIKHNLDMINRQTYKNIEVVISDHSKSDIIYNVVLKWIGKLNIKYIKNEDNIGSSSANINNAINNCSGDLIKIIFQDDFLFDEDSVYLTVKNFDLSKFWLVTTCLHTTDGVNFYNKHTPRWNDLIYTGINTISSPSVLTIRNDVDLRFDNDLIWLMDVDMYKKLFDRYGKPMILNEITVVNRIWGSQLSNTIPKEIKDKELQKMVDTYVLR